MASSKSNELTLGDRDGRCDLSRDEMDKFGKAFQNEEFRNLFLEYVEELADPENRRKINQDVVAFERGAKILKPEPNYVIKTNAKIQNRIKKAFVNISHNENVRKAHENKETGEWNVPHIISKPRDDLDKKGRDCLVYDVLFNPHTLEYEAAEEPIKYRRMIEEIAMEAVEKNYDVKLERPVKYPKLKFKGTPGGLIINEANARESAVGEWDQSAPESKVPKYVLKYRYNCDIQDYAIIPNVVVKPRSEEDRALSGGGFEAHIASNKGLVDSKLTSDEIPTTPNGKCPEASKMGHLTPDGGFENSAEGILALNKGSECVIETTMGHSAEDKGLEDTELRTSDSTKESLTSALNADASNVLGAPKNGPAFSCTGPKATELVVEISLPDIDSAKDLDLDIRENRLVLKSSSGSRYELNVRLPLIVADDSGKATFNRDGRMLVVEIPIVDYGESKINEISRPLSEVHPREGKRDEADKGNVSDEMCGNGNDNVKIHKAENANDVMDENNNKLPLYKVRQDSKQIVFNFNIEDAIRDSVEWTFPPGGNRAALSFSTTKFTSAKRTICLSFAEGRTIDPRTTKFDIGERNVVLIVGKTVRGGNDDDRVLWKDFGIGCQWGHLTPGEIPSVESLTKAIRKLQRDCFEGSDKKVVNDESHSVNINKVSDDAIEIVQKKEIPLKHPSKLSHSMSLQINTRKAQLRKKVRSFSESSHNYATSPTGDPYCLKGILKYPRRSRTVSESSEDASWSSPEFIEPDSDIPEEDGEEKQTEEKKNVRFSEVVRRSVFRSNSSILNHRRKNRNKNNKNDRRSSESECSEGEQKEPNENQTTNEKKKKRSAKTKRNNNNNHKKSNKVGNTGSAESEQSDDVEFISRSEDEDAIITENDTTNSDTENSSSWVIVRSKKNKIPNGRADRTKSDSGCEMDEVNDKGLAEIKFEIGIETLGTNLQNLDLSHSLILSNKMMYELED